MDPSLAGRLAFISGAAGEGAAGELARRGDRVFARPVDMPALLASCSAERTRSELCDVERPPVSAAKRAAR